MRYKHIQKLKKRFLAFSFATVFLLLPLNASAAVTSSYSRIDTPNGTENRLSREMYSPAGRITADTFGMDNGFEGITDMYSSGKGNILLLCGEESRLISIDGDYSSALEIQVKDKGNPVNFKGAQGIYSDNDGNIYIADTDNSRILITGYDGSVKNVIETPVSDLIPEDFIFQPTAIEKDDQGYTYILSRGCYYGALMYTPEYEFMGFYGANTVKSSALDTLSYLWDKLTSNEAKKSASVKTIPYSFTDFCFDSEGYMITITGTISSDRYAGSGLTGHIRKISPNGANILFKRSIDGGTVSSSNINFLESEKPDGAEVQDLVSVAESGDGYIFVLDGGNGTVYIYDSECNLLSAFGGGYNQGEQSGVFKNAVSLALNGDDVLVADKADGSVTVFGQTGYGSLLRKAQTLYLKGNYDEAKPLWESVLSYNRNCQLAYRGLAMVYYNDGKYEASLEAARAAYDKSVYDMAQKQIISRKIADNFLIIVAAFVVIAAAVIYLRKSKKKIFRNPKIKLVFEIPFHPFEGFDDLKYKNMGSAKIAVTITVLFYIASVSNVMFSGFLYSDTLLRNYNSLYTLAGTAGLLMLWSVCNWLVCCTFSGKGTFGEVYTATSYSLCPWIIFLIAKTVLSNFLSLGSAGLISGLQTAVLIFTFFLLSVAMMKIHEYDFFRFLFTAFVSLFLMVLAAFIIFMCAILMAQLGTFIVSVYEEIAYR